MFILLSCACNRIVGVNQPVAFFAASAENISFVLHRRKVIRAFMSWVSVAARCGTGRGLLRPRARLRRPAGAGGAAGGWAPSCSAFERSLELSRNAFCPGHEYLTFVWLTSLQPADGPLGAAREGMCFGPGACSHEFCASSVIIFTSA